MFSNNKQVVRVCKVCKDAGKSEAEYTSHFVRSEPGPKGVVICPTLLSAECSYCRATGHIRAYCVQLKKQQKIEERNQAANTYSKIQTANKLQNVVAKSNRFSALECDASASDKQDEIRAVSPITISTPIYKPILTGYAKAAASQPVVVEKPKPRPRPTSPTTPPPNFASNMEFPIIEQKKIPVQKTPVRNPLIPGFTKSWADYSDSDTDEDDY